MHLEALAVRKPFDNMSIAIFLDVLKKLIKFPREGKLDLMHVGVLWLVALIRHHLGCVDDLSAR
jgi:hypothetical protein